MSVSRVRASQELEAPVRLGLVEKLHLGGRLRYALSDRGLTFLARRDRLSVPGMLRRWSTSPTDPSVPRSWDNMRGIRARQLARHVAHTGAVHRFLAALGNHARHQGHKLLLYPPHLAQRSYREGGRTFTLKPDAYGQYRTGSVVHHFFLEWEQRATHPAQFREKLAPYLRYYSTRQPLEDYGAYPSLLLVFRDELMESSFLRVAVREIEAAKVNMLSAMATYAAIVEAQGPLSPIWRQSVGSSRRKPW
jgi:hypothetical protein